MRILRWLLPFVSLALFAACAPKPVPPLDHEAYIWQRQWTPALAASLDAMRGDFSGWRVLAAESAADGELTDAAPDLALLARSGKPVVAVFRLNGNRPPPEGEALAKRITDLAAAWRGAGVALAGVEIDHDCATSQLDTYAALLAALRASIPHDLRLSITALPTWVGAPALARVLAQADASVLQVHAISAPGAGRNETGLFDADQAQRWIAAYAAVAPKPFRIALPAYGVRVGFDEDGRAIAVESETPRAMETERTREVRADPADVDELLRHLERARPARLEGIVWFRLPSEDDRRAWSLATLHGVIARKALKPSFATFSVAAQDGASEIVIANRGALDAPQPESVAVAAKNCSAADALAGFHVEPVDGGWLFFSESREILRAGHERRIGWVRCESIDKVLPDAHP